MLKTIVFGVFVLLVMGARAAWVQAELALCHVTAAAGCVERCTHIDSDM